MASPFPKSISRTESGLNILWSDGCSSKLDGETLRRNCPSANERVARQELNHEKPLTQQKSSQSVKPNSIRRGSLKVVKATIDEAFKINEIWPVGRYAIGIKYGDGHSTGIYSFSLLYQLSELDSSFSTGS